MKPCPFCGNRVVRTMKTTRDSFGNELKVEYGFSCHYCGALVYFKDNSDMDKAEECWEKRAEVKE